jgi:hypothetical protein
MMRVMLYEAAQSVLRARYLSLLHCVCLRGSHWPDDGERHLQEPFPIRFSRAEYQRPWSVRASITSESELGANVGIDRVREPNQTATPKAMKLRLITAVE